MRIQTDRYGPITGRFKDRYYVTTEAKLLPFTPVGCRSHSGPTDDSVGLPPEIAKQLEVGHAFVVPDRFGKPLPHSCWEVVEKAPSVWLDHPEWVRIFVKPKREPATNPMRVGGISTGEFDFRPDRRAA